MASSHGRIQSVEPLSVGWETQRTLSPSGLEIEAGRFLLSRQNASRLIASMDERQRERLIVELRCYGSEKLLCTLIFDDQDTHFLESKALQHWYKENGVEPGDVIC